MRPPVRTVCLFAALTALCAPSAPAAEKLASVTASVGCGITSSSNDCFTDITFYQTSPSFITDHYGNVTVEVDYTAAYSATYWYDDDFDADFTWTVGGSQVDSASESCSGDCNRTGKLSTTMTSANGTTTYSVGLSVDVDSDCGDCSDSSTKTVSITRPLCATVIGLDDMDDVNQHYATVWIYGAVTDTDCGDTFSDAASVDVVVRDPSWNAILNTTIDLTDGLFSVGCTLPSSNDPNSYGTYTVTAAYDPSSPSGHDREDCSGATETFSRIYNLHAPSPPRSADAFDYDEGSMVSIADTETNIVHLFPYGSSIPSLDVPLSGAISMQVNGAAFFRPSPRQDPLFAISQDGDRRIVLVDLEGRPVLDYPAPVAVPFGLAFDGEALWVSDASSGELARFDPGSGQLLRSLQPGLGGLADIAFDEVAAGWGGPTLLVLTAPPAAPRVHRLRPADGAILETIDLPPGGPYYAMDAVAGRIHVADFETWDFWDITPGTPAPPEGLRAASGPDTPDRIRLSWSDPDAEPAWTEILVHRDGTAIDTVPPGAQEYVDEGLPPRTWHDYHLVARNAGADRSSASSDTAGCYAGVRPPVVHHVPADHSSIQAAIFAAMDGDTVLVAPGIYTGAVRFAGRQVRVLSAAGPGETVLDARGSHLSPVVFDSTEGEGAVLSGFTIRGADLRHGTGVVQIGPAASPRIEGNVITADTLWFGGGAVLCEGGQPVVERNTIAGNLGRPDTLGVFRGGAVLVTGGSPSLRANLIAGNDSLAYAIACAGGTPQISCNDVWDGFLGRYDGAVPGPGDIEEDPLFLDPAAGDLRLCADSPCLEGYGCGRIGALGAGGPACGSSIDWADHQAGNCVLTVTDRGILGFMDASQAAGSGFVYPAGGENNLYIGGLWVGAGPTYVANRDYDADPAREWEVSESPNGHVSSRRSGYADPAIHTRYRDSAAVQPRGLIVHQESWSFAVPPAADDLVILHYRLRNDSPAPLSGLYAGLFLDLDLGSYTENSGRVEAQDGFVYLTGGTGVHAGACRLETEGAPPAANLTLIDNATYVWPLQYVADADKFAFLAASDPAHVMTATPAPGDYGVLASAGPFDLAPGGQAALAFAVAGGASLEDLRANIAAARLVEGRGVTAAPDAPASPLAGTAPSSLRLLPPRPNPFGSTTTLAFELARGNRVDLGVFDVAGRRVASPAAGDYPAGHHLVVWDGRDERGRRVPDGVYFLRLVSQGRARCGRILVLGTGR